MDEVTNATASVGGILERLLDEAEAASTPAPDASPPPQPSLPAEAVPGRGGSPMASLLSNPAVLSALPSLMENLSPLLSGLRQGIGSSPAATRPHTVDRHTALLCAIKPYLSPHRRETAETVIRLCRIWDALEKSGISLSGLLGSIGSGATADREWRDSHV